MEGVPSMRFPGKSPREGLLEVVGWRGFPGGCPLEGIHWWTYCWGPRGEFSAVVALVSSWGYCAMPSEGDFWRGSFRCDPMDGFLEGSVVGPIDWNHRKESAGRGTDGGVLP
jgi:hypothetical protein